MRKKLDLDQRVAGEIFGGGANAFSRYENGKTKPPLALVKLLKILERHPDLMTTIAVGRETWPPRLRGLLRTEDGSADYADYADFMRELFNLI